MLHAAAIPGAGARLLPQLETRLSCLANTAVGVARDLLALCDCPLLSVRDGRGVSPFRCVPWDRSFDLRLDIAAALPLGARTAPFAHQLSKIGAEIAFLLERRWPDYAQPFGVALISDGTGLGVSVNSGSRLARDWLWRHALGDANLPEIIPFTPSGAWAGLTHANVSPSLH